jgi:hypothetical protein
LIGKKYPELYVEISEGRFFICQLKKRGKCFFCSAQCEVALDHLAVRQGLLYNTSIIYVETKKFLEKNELLGARALVCCPELQHYDGAKKKLVVFQISLSLCKAGIVIDRMFEERLFE